jgi:hypothetical protein
MDILYAVLNFEEEFYHEGKQEGEEKGARDGHVEGYDFGVAKGRQIGEEIGNISGLVNCLLHWLEVGYAPIPLNERLVKNLEILRDLIAHFPHDKPHDDEYNVQLENIRSKYKLLEIRLGIVMKKKGVEISKQENNSLAF